MVSRDARLGIALATTQALHSVRSAVAAQRNLEPSGEGRVQGRMMARIKHNETPVPIKTTGTEAVKELILWARANRIAFTMVTFGDVSVHLADLELAGSVVLPKRTEAEAAENMFTQYGGDVLKAALEQSNAMTPTEDDDEE